jgi:FMN reductase
MRIAVVAGNPQAGSRTLQAAILTSARISGGTPDEVIDVVTLGSGLLGWNDPQVKEAVTAVQSADVAVVASPTFKGAYTGVLKLFLDQFPSGGLAGVVAVPLMLGAGLGHALAPELLLKPVLVELGATCPTRALYLLDSDWEQSPLLDQWLENALPKLRASLGEDVR